MYEETVIKDDGTKITTYYEHWHESVFVYFWFSFAMFLVGLVGLISFPFVAIYLLFAKKSMGTCSTNKLFQKVNHEKAIK